MYLLLLPLIWHISLMFGTENCVIITPQCCKCSMTIEVFYVWTVLFSDYPSEFATKLVNFASRIAYVSELGYGLPSENKKCMYDVKDYSIQMSNSAINIEKPTPRQLHHQISNQ